MPECVVPGPEWTVRLTSPKCSRSVQIVLYDRHALSNPKGQPSPIMLIGGINGKDRALWGLAA